MGGLAGLLLAQPRLHGDALAAQARAMGEALRHRGPAENAAWVDAQAGIALAYQRSGVPGQPVPAGQPLQSADGRHVLACDGVLHNHAQLRAALSAVGHRFRGHSDAEVLVAGVAEWGVEETLQRCNGMFAMAVWDRRERCLWLARDQAGAKPLYYGWAGDCLVFGSELKALWRHPRFDNGVDRGALALLLRLGYIPAPHCIHERAFKLAAGSVIRLDSAAVATGAVAHDPSRHQRRWWDPQARMRQVLAEAPFTGSDDEAADALDALLRDAIGLRIEAGGPAGVFLGGGASPALVAALAQARGGAQVRSFSLGFHGAGDGGAQAREMAGRLGMTHTEFGLDGSDALELVPQLPAMFDEPFADVSGIPFAVACRLARQEVGVALSGVGGDELFLGHERYRRALRSWRIARALPLPLRRGLGRLAGAGDQGPASLLARAGARGIGDTYRRQVSHWQDPGALVPGAREPQTIHHQADPLGLQCSEAAALVLADFMARVPDDLLCGIDRASTAAGLDVRTPLLDWRVAEFAWSLPTHMKIRSGAGGFLPGYLLRRYLPDALVEQAGQGCDVPLGEWLRGDLAQWAADLLAPAALRRDGLLDAARVDAARQAFNRGRRQWQSRLWTVLAFQAWRAHWRASRGD